MCVCFSGRVCVCFLGFEGVLVACLFLDVVGGFGSFFNKLFFSDCDFVIFVGYGGLWVGARVVVVFFFSCFGYFCCLRFFI